MDSDAPGGTDVWELGSLRHRTGYLRRMRQRDPARARELLAAAWGGETPEERTALLAALGTGLSRDDEPLLEQALDDRRAQVREVALDLLGRLPDSGYGRRMAQRARECVDLAGTGRIDVTPPAACDRAMRRDGVIPRPPARTGERAWWLEEILARTPLSTWPAPEEFRSRGVSEEWAATVRRGLARAAATQRHGAWAVVLLGPLAAEVAAHGYQADRQLLATLYHALPAGDLAAWTTSALRRGLGTAAATGIEQALALCPKPWPPAVADVVLGALDEQLRRHGADWRVSGVCELAALGLPADLAPRARALAHEWRAARPNDPGVTVVERFAATLRYRSDMHKELA